MLYSDSEVHDDVSPLDNPRHAANWPGLYLSHVPGVPKLDIRVEGVSTDPSGSCITGGLYMYWEEIEREGTPTRASSSATGSDAKTRVGGPGLRTTER
jgi:hypothetical protein